jgi:LPS O-antigen subunit length determinant protein (WzzB/FepE family)
MQLKYNTYTVLNTQLQAAMAKVQEYTPAFTELQGASVPVKPEGPRRMIFIIGMTFLVCVITALWVSRKELHIEL